MPASMPPAAHQKTAFGFLGNLSLGKRIMLLTTVGLLVGAGLLSYPGLKAANEATEMMLEDRLTTARLVASHLDESLGVCIDLLRETANRIDPITNPQTTQEETNVLWTTYARLSVYVDSLYMFDGQGELVWSNPGSSGVSLATLLPADTTGDETAISGLVSSPISNVPVVLLSACVAGDETGGSGWLIAAVDLARSGFVGFVRPVRLGNTGYVEIVDNAGTVIARTQPGPTMAPFEKSDHSGHFSELIASGEPTRGLCHNCHVSQEKVVTRDVLAFVPLTTAAWGVVIRQSEQEALAPIRRLRWELGISIIGLIGVAFLIAAATARDVANRLKTLMRVSQHIAEGDFNTPVVTTRSDEVGVLGQTLESMRSRLKTSYAEIERRTKELSSLLSVSEVLASLPDLSDLASAVGLALERTVEIMKVDAGGLLVRNEEKDVFQYLAQRGFPAGYAEAAVYRADAIGETTPPEEAVSILEALRQESGRTLRQDLATLDMKMAHAIPLHSKRGTSGVLLLSNREDRQLAAGDQRLVTGIARYIATALENARLHQEVQLKEAVRGELLQDMLTVQEEERRRIARELHDETSQVLASVNANLQVAIASLEPGGGKTETLLKKVQSMSVDILDNVNRLIYQLRPSLLDDLGLVAAIRWLGNNNLKPAGVSLHLTTRGRRRRMARDTETAIFRVVQETFNNVARHARAKNVQATLKFEAGQVTLDIVDDGIGFDVEEAIHATARPRGLGLLGMRERIELIGGRISIHSDHANGTQVHIEIPDRKENAGGQDKNTPSG